MTTDTPNAALDAAKAEDAAAHEAFFAAREKVFDALRDNPSGVSSALVAMGKAATAMSLASYKVGIEMGRHIYGDYR